ncbi:MAG: hypothetical protein JKY37_12355 [Nannocystaceae bacterium]|nr:hypothetical protein [Nannocystaceae bacterium]
MRQPLYLRLRPFLRRDLKARLVSALVAVFVMSGLSWLGISALTKIDSAEAHALRIELGLEHPWAVCGGLNKPGCNYDDRHQEKVDRKFASERGLRVAILDELSDRTTMAIGQLDEAEDLLREMKTNPSSGVLEGDTVALRDALTNALVDVAPAPIASTEARRPRLLGALEGLANIRVMGGTGRVGWVGTGEEIPQFGLTQGDRLIAAIRDERTNLMEVAKRIGVQRARDGQRDDDDARDTSRIDLVEEVTPPGNAAPVAFNRRLETAGWLSVQAHVSWPGDGAVHLIDSGLLDMPARQVVSGEMPQIDAALARLARYDLEALHNAISTPVAPLWHDGWTGVYGNVAAPIHKQVARYRSPIDDSARWRLLGAAAFLFASIMLIVVGPVVTATTTAREREAGTLPVLRMTGLSAGDLAVAMAIGPNVFALVSGMALLLLGTVVLTFTAGPAAIAMPLALLVALSCATHLTAIGLGEEAQACWAYTINDTA